jgi:hypothetical protein
MNRLRCMFVNVLAMACLCLVSVTKAGAADIQVYKGELRVLIPDQPERDSLSLQYRTKSREVLGIGLSGLSMLNMRTKKIIRLDDRSSRIENNIVDGAWNTEIVYSHLNLAGGDYRVTGRITFFMARSQQSRSFSVLLRPAVINRPYESSIDWGIPGR